eukprot:scaffold23320_cov129-Isochrysis_galbana.AAC.1
MRLPGVGKSTHGRGRAEQGLLQQRCRHVPGVARPTCTALEELPQHWREVASPLHFIGCDCGPAMEEYDEPELPVAPDDRARRPAIGRRVRSGKSGSGIVRRRRRRR